MDTVGGAVWHGRSPTGVAETLSVSFLFPGAYTLLQHKVQPDQTKVIETVQRLWNGIKAIERPFSSKSIQVCWNLSECSLRTKANQRHECYPAMLSFPFPAHTHRLSLDYQQHNNMSSDERTADIWATRIQRELLALTTEDAEASDSTKAMLPGFVSIKAHKLNLAEATCTVDAEIEVEGSTIIVQLDASFHKPPGSYPFAPPVPKLVAGAGYFPEGSTIQTGDHIAMDLEWTPSLHLADAIVNISLKIKESLLQNEPFHPAPRPEADLASNALRIASSLGQKASKFGKALATPPARKAAATAKPKKTPRTPSTPDSIKIGDEINLLEEPWVDARGLYACKALRRPTFVSDAMELAEQTAEQQSFASPTAMFRSFTKSARNVLQESFLMITDTHILELKSSKLNPTTATITFLIAIDLMHKLKFRRHESVSLFFKPAPEDPLVYMCPDAGDAVHQIQAVLKNHGVKGKHTSAAAHKAIAQALQLVQEIQTKEVALKHDPSVERVNDIMDLYRQAAERFEAAGDMRHEEVVMHMRKFLALPLTASILDGSFQRPPSPPRSPQGNVPEGEVLESAPYMDDDYDESTHSPVPRRKSLQADREFEENMDNLLKEAQEDLQKLKSDKTMDTADLEHSPSDLEDSSIAQVSADLDAMMKQADAELAEVMKS